MKGETRENIPAIFVVFGITGYLASKRILPALLGLYSRKMLPDKFAIIGFSRRSFSREDFRQFIRDNLEIYPGQYKEEEVKHFLDKIDYESGTFENRGSYERLYDKVRFFDNKFKQCSNKFYHLAVPPDLYEVIIKNLKQSKLNLSCESGYGETKILVEKPFGFDIDNAVKIERNLADSFEEEQIFRIDHYLAKESMQNILTFRFTNSLFEHIWNSQYIDHIHIKLIEKATVSDWGSSYDKIGALKDVGQNHLLQMLASIAMEKPKDFSAEEIRRERTRVLRSIKTLSPKEIKDSVIRGQYDGYKIEEGVSPVSMTESYFLVESKISNSRWQGTSFYLESGKAMKDDRSEILVYFKNKEEPDKQNILVFKIQPEEGIKIRFWAKVPGFPKEIESRTLSFNYMESVNANTVANAYEKLLYDVIVGDQTLFMTTDDVVASWKFITSILNNWSSIPLLSYKKGSLGPLSS